MQYETPAPGKDSGPHEGPHLPALRFDAEAYRHHLAEADLPPAQQTELLETVWLIVVGFVDLGFNQLPVQQVINKMSLVPDSPAVLASGNIEITQQQEAEVRSNRRVAGERIHEEI